MGTEAPNAKITRHFVTLGDRQVHYRRAGSGPPVLLLHQSPKSSRELAPVMEALADRFTTIAPDTPGNGNSDPLPLDHPTMADYGDNTAMVLDALGIDKVGVYGFHTGACVGGAFSARHPDRVHVAILNGFVTLTGEERADIMANYLTPFAPTWDGGHLTWLWARLREQTVFFPWYAPTLANRMDMNMATPDMLQDGLLEFLRAGDEYRKPYGAAFEFAGDEWAPRFSAPTYLVASDWDPLSAHLPRLPEGLPDCVTVKNLGPGTDNVLPWVTDTLARYVSGPDAPPAPAPAQIEGRSWQDFVAVPGGQLHVRRTSGANGVPVLVHHDAAGDNAIVDRVTASLAGKRTAFAFDMPGNGESDNVIGTDNINVESYAEVIEHAIDSLGLDAIDVYGMWGGGLVGLDLAIRRPHQVKHLCISSVLYHTAEERADLLANYTAPIEIDWYGGHLLRCWHFMRDQALFWPWYRRTREGIIWSEPWIEPEGIHARVVAMLKAGDMYHHAYQAHFSYPTHERLQEVGVPTLLCSPTWGGTIQHSEAAAKAAPQCKYAILPTAMEAWSKEFLPFFDS